MFDRINFKIFLPPFILLALSVIISLIDAVWFVSILDQCRKWILSYFDWLFNLTVFCFLLLSLAAYYSPLGKIKIGGQSAVPIFKKGKWLAVVICTTVATGILFWGSAEPLFHLHIPPSDSLEAFSYEAGVVSMSTLFMHWTFSPYALYSMIALLFALAFYQYKLPFRVSSMIRIHSSKDTARWYLDIIDAVCLFALVAGMAASLGAGVMTISGGLNELFSSVQGPALWGVITITIVAAFISSSVSGLKRGIKWLSLSNMAFFILMIIIFGVLSMDLFALELAGKGIVDYVVNIIPRSIGISDLNRNWEQDWTSFYWANWMAWAPVTALFLGRLGLGYTVREFIRFNLIYPSLFSLLWITIFGGVALSADLQSEGELYNILENGGPQDVIFSLVNSLPFGQIGATVFLLVVYISYVTAADSNTSAMSGLSARGVSYSHPEAPVFMKIIWGILIAIVSWVMISFAGIEGIKILSVIGGFPVLFLCIAIIVIFIKLIVQSKN